MSSNSDTFCSEKQEKNPKEGEEERAPIKERREESKTLLPLKKVKFRSEIVFTIRNPIDPIFAVQNIHSG